MADALSFHVPLSKTGLGIRIDHIARVIRGLYEDYSRLYWVYIARGFEGLGVILTSYQYRGYMGLRITLGNVWIMKKKMETTISVELGYRVYRFLTAVHRSG